MTVARVEELILENRQVLLGCRKFHRMRKWKWLFVNGRECDSPSSTATRCLDSCEEGKSDQRVW